MIATHVITNRPCTSCGRNAVSALTSFRAILHQNNDGEVLGIYCRAVECSDAETRAWKAGTR